MKSKREIRKAIKRCSKAHDLIFKSLKKQYVCPLTNKFCNNECDFADGLMWVLGDNISLMDLRGIAPNLTDGLSSENFVRKIRTKLNNKKK